MATRQIVALSGGGFLMEPGNPRLDNHLLELLGSTRRRVCFIPTASGDSADFIVRFYQAYPASRCQPSHLPLFVRGKEELRARLLEQDAVFVGPGNTLNMLALWRLHGLDAVLREAWEQGVMLCGMSAGAMCWFEGGLTDSLGSLAPFRNGLGLLPGTLCPHYDSEPERRPAYQRFISEGLSGGLAADDGVGFHFIGTQLTHTFSSREKAQAWRVERTEAGVREQSLPVTLLQ
ncbi:peptidase E [Hyalangium rubrum]|uniref:Peptidase E n=1 Tax=Hyalangium rubrum TaxID=3103134 RepID=A0ABU5HF85_9BACT|nr:peptidase E [Hyalangium sp. s54d21]MDY7232130.1 peptidase E [Hyalangium sp. s54d21]